MPTRDQLLSHLLPGLTTANQTLAARAKAGDSAAIAQLTALARPDLGNDLTYQSAPQGQRNTLNFARDQLNQDTGTNLAPVQGKSVGDALGELGGDALKYGSALGASLIPGIGPLAAGAIAAGGNSLGQVIHGDKFNPLGAALSGVAGGAGSALLNGGASALGGIPAAPSAAGLPGIGDVSSIGLSGAAGGAGAALAPVAGAGAASAAGAVPSALSLGGIIKTVGKNLPLIGGVLGTITGASQQNHANDLQNQAIQAATQDWNARAPVRQAAITRALAPLPAAPDLSYIYANSSNPYAKVKP